LQSLEQTTAHASYASKLPLGVLDVLIVSAPDFPASAWQRRTVWESGGCRSCVSGRPNWRRLVIWPGSVVAYMRRTRAVAELDYMLSSGETEKFKYSGG
jgi:hypothetical protein